LHQIGAKKSPNKVAVHSNYWPTTIRITSIIAAADRNGGASMFESPVTQTDAVAGDFADCPKPTHSTDHEIGALMCNAIPELRTYGRSLSGSHDLAEDLVQETLLKAWVARDRFRPGTNFRAWTFMILRNVFLSQMRRKKFSGPWDAVIAEKLLQEPAPQDKYLELDDVCQALLQLPAQQREAVLFVGAGGFSYDETAGACNCAVGTIKSRVARGRILLGQILEEGPARRRLRAGCKKSRSATEQIFSELNTIACQ
jgi:RNA polymerase sigma-70 factor (ECF subfamily)